MDKQDAEKYAAAFELLAGILDRKHISDEEHHVPFVLGDLARRVFVGSQFDPPDELLEQVARTIRSGDETQRGQMARRLRDHAEHLEQWPRSD